MRSCPFCDKFLSCGRPANIRFNVTGGVVSMNEMPREIWDARVAALTSREYALEAERCYNYVLRAFGGEKNTK